LSQQESIADEKIRQLSSDNERLADANESASSAA